MIFNKKSFEEMNKLPATKQMLGYILYSKVAVNDFEFCKILVKLGADVNYTIEKDYGATPLILACEYGHLKIAYLLLENGANPHIIDKKFNENAFQHAINYGDQNLINLLEMYKKTPQIEAWMN